jgi:hypothetical protein
VLKPGGRLICSTHGDHYRYLLTGRDEIARYEAGRIVVQGGYEEGRKWFFALHPPRAVETELLQDFEDVRRVAPVPDARLFQDIWVATKPATGAD